MKSMAPMKTIQRQRGVSVLFAMLSMVALSFAAAGLVRATSSNSLVVGNLAFKADSAAFADVGTEAAVRWLDSRVPSVLQSDSPANGYSATSIPALDPTGQRIYAAPLVDPLAPLSLAPTTQSRVVIDWKANGCGGYTGTFDDCRTPSAPVTGANGNSYQYFITRLCASDGSVETNTCATKAEENDVGNQNRDSVDYQNYEKLKTQTVLQPSYRIIVRAAGPRNAVTFTEAIVRK
jgi:type IV pilus assembly protein PilX